MSRREFEPLQEQMRQMIPEAGQAIADMTAELYRAPRSEAAHSLAQQLDGLRVLVMRFRQSLLAEGEGHDR